MKKAKLNGEKLNSHLVIKDGALYTQIKNKLLAYDSNSLFEIRVDTQEKKLDNENQVIGLDFDCDDMYIDSNGKSALKDFGFKKQKQLNSKKLSHLQRQFLRKVKNSKNKEKARIKLAKFEEHIANCRKDWIEKETNRLVNSYQVIGIENLLLF